MNTMLGRMGAVYRVLRKTFGVKVIPLFLAVLFGVVRTVVAIGMALDNLFFPKLAKTRANRPIVLVGNPRTGTTFLQRFLSDEGFGAGMELFLMLYPSLLLQKFLRPLLPLLEKISPAKYHSTEAHQTSLSSVETDDVAVLFRHLDGFFLYGFFLSCDEEDRLSWVRPARARHLEARHGLAGDALAAQPGAAQGRPQHRQGVLVRGAAAAVPRSASPRRGSSTWRAIRSR